MLMKLRRVALPFRDPEFRVCILQRVYFKAACVITPWRTFIENTAPPTSAPRSSSVRLLFPLCCHKYVNGRLESQGARTEAELIVVRECGDRSDRSEANLVWICEKSEQRSSRRAVR